MIFKRFTTAEKAYQSSLALRNTYLRKPLGLTLSEDDTAGEAQQLHFGIFEEEQILASVTLKDLGNGKMKLRQMVVDQSLPRSGLGTMLIRNAEEALRTMDCHEITMAARVSAKGFYEKLGYQVYGSCFLELGIEHITMCKVFE